MCAALPIAAASVYLLHDVDRDMLGRLNDAFLGLCTESTLFALVVGGAAGLLATLGRSVLHLGGYSPRAITGFFAGIGVTICQYPWDIVARKLFPGLQQTSLSVYIFVAMFACVVVLLRDAFKQKRILEAASSSSGTSTHAPRTNERTVS